MQYTNQQELSVEQLATVFKKAGLSRPVNNQQILEKCYLGLQFYGQLGMVTD